MTTAKKLAALVSLTLLLTLHVHAGDHGGEILLEPAFKYLIIKPIINLCICIKQALWIQIHGLSFAENCDRAILYNPPVGGVRPLLNLVLKIMLPVYSLLIVFVGFYLLILSSSPEGRTRAKFMLGKLMIVIVLISASPLLIDATFTISRELTEGIFSITGVEIIKDIFKNGHQGMMVYATWLMVPEGVLGLIPFILTFVFAWLPYVIISLRSIMLTALMIAFPLGILFYSIPSLKSIGRTILEQFLVWTFLQAFMAIALVSVAKAYLVTNFDPNPTISCLHTEMVAASAVAIGPAAIVIAIITLLIEIMAVSGMNVPFISTDLKTLGFGAVAYAVIIISPLIVTTVLKKFLP